MIFIFSKRTRFLKYVIKHILLSVKHLLGDRKKRKTLDLNVCRKILIGNLKFRRFQLYCSNIH